MDNYLRNLQRDAATGDYYAVKAWKRALLRAGYPDPDNITHPLSDAECIQEDYDELAWQGRPWKGMLYQWCGVGCCGYIAGTASKLVKGRDMDFSRNLLAKNSKKKTLRTHRDGSRRR